MSVKNTGNLMAEPSSLSATHADSGAAFSKPHKSSAFSIDALVGSQKAISSNGNTGHHLQSYPPQMPEALLQQLLFQAAPNFTPMMNLNTFNNTFTATLAELLLQKSRLMAASVGTTSAPSPSSTIFAPPAIRLKRPLVNDEDNGEDRAEAKQPKTSRNAPAYVWPLGNFPATFGSTRPAYALPTGNNECLSVEDRHKTVFSEFRNGMATAHPPATTFLSNLNKNHCNSNHNHFRFNANLLPPQLPVNFALPFRPPLPPLLPFVSLPSSMTTHPSFAAAAAAMAAAANAAAAAASSHVNLSVSASVAQNRCAVCNATFRLTSDLVFHMRSHHRSHATPGVVVTTSTALVSQRQQPTSNIDSNGAAVASRRQWSNFGLSPSPQVGDSGRGDPDDNVKQHSEASASYSPPSTNKRFRNEKLKCLKCGEYFRERHHLTRHLGSHKQDDEAEAEKAALLPLRPQQQEQSTDPLSSAYVISGAAQTNNA